MPAYVFQTGRGTDANIYLVIAEDRNRAIQLAAETEGYDDPNDEDFDPEITEYSTEKEGAHVIFLGE